MIFSGLAVFWKYIAMCKKNNIGSFANDGCFPCRGKNCCSLCFSSQSVPLDFLANSARSNVTVYTACPATIKLERVAVTRDGEGSTVTNVSVCSVLRRKVQVGVYVPPGSRAGDGILSLPCFSTGLVWRCSQIWVQQICWSGVALHHPPRLLPRVLTRITCLIAACLPGRYGTGCARRCRCPTGTPCHHLTGECSCPPGFTGYGCEKSEFVIRMQKFSL